MWAIWPSILKITLYIIKLEKKCQSELLEKVLAAQKFNQGFETTEYLASSILDQALHQLTPNQVPSADELLFL